MLPNFLIIGAMKSGTTSLWRYVRAHPDVYMPDAQELDFFVEELNWPRGRSWYEGHFEGGRGALRLGEASSNYSKYPRYRGVPERIHSVLGPIKLVYVLRDPIERLRSHYLHEVAKGREARPLAQAIAEKGDYVAFSRYWMQLEQYLPIFPPDRILLITSEALRVKRARTLHRVAGFLELSRPVDEDALDQEFNVTAAKREPTRLDRGMRKLPGFHTIASKAPRPLHSLYRKVTTTPLDTERATITPELRDELEGIFREDVVRLRSLMDDGFDGWGIA